MFKLQLHYTSAAFSVFASACKFQAAPAKTSIIFTAPIVDVAAC